MSSMRIRISKRLAVQGGLPPRDFEDHIPGHVQPAGFSLPIDYTIEGELVGSITVGEPVVVNRDTRNGVKSEGRFQTSTVTQVTKHTFQTQNSVYDFEILQDGILVPA